MQLVKTLNGARRAAIAANSQYLTTPVRPLPSPSYLVVANQAQHPGKAINAVVLHHGRVQATHARSANQRRQLVRAQLGRPRGRVRAERGARRRRFLHEN